MLALMVWFLVAGAIVLTGVSGLPLLLRWRFRRRLHRAIQTATEERRAIQTLLRGTGNDVF